MKQAGVKSYRCVELWAFRGDTHRDKHQQIPLSIPILGGPKFETLRAITDAAGRAFNMLQSDLDIPFIKTVMHERSYKHHTITQKQISVRCLRRDKIKPEQYLPELFPL